MAPARRHSTLPRSFSMALALCAALLLACGGDDDPAPVAGTPASLEASPLTLIDGGQGGVTVRVTWVTQEFLASPEMERADRLDLSQYLAFYVQLDTDSSDLSKYDLSRISVLRDLSGGEYQPEAWLPWSIDGSHRKGLLLFHRVELGGDGVELVIRGVGGVTERSYRWFAPPEG